ncbi:porin [Nocardia panacis]|uniref:Porin n=1 Tax=Nocardia panacis TaxID=2340916 RepID=A0A3A4KIK4_9NOCA|nr:MspA family porin [Nocardia panacis]RJO73513.1 porin [Nocardia panacis]
MRNSKRVRRRYARAVAAVAIVVAGLAVGAGAATAGIDSTNAVVDHGDRTVEAIQRDTRIDFVPPLDGNPLTREWFHDGEAGFRIGGPDAESWSGHVTIGYQVGYPATLNGRIKFNWNTPGLGVDLGGSDGVKARIDSLIPQFGVELDAGFGPGIQSVECAGGDVSGSDGFIRMSGFHGSVTGVLGQTTIRPWVRVVGSSGDTVVTYGRTWTI